MLEDQVKRCRCQIISNDLKLAQQNKHLQSAEFIKKEITQDLSSIKQSVGNIGNKTEQLLQRKEKLEKKLKMKKQEMIIITAKQEQPHNILPLTKDEITELAEEKEKEITEHKKELEEVEVKLKQSAAQISEYEEQLLQFTSELRELFEKLQSFRQTNAQTKQELDLKRGRVDQFRMQQTAAEESEERYKREIKVIILIIKVIVFSLNTF